MKIKIAICSMILLWVILWSCSNSKDGVHFAAEPYETLAEYGFFQGPIADLNPSEGVLPYDLSNPLFSDYALKSRFVWMPEGSSASYTDEGILDFPQDAVLIKSCLLYTSPSPRDLSTSRMPSSA